MAFRSSLRLLLVLLFSHTALSLRATPNSPCASLCIDSSNLDPSDPDSFTTNGSDITCDDGDFAISPAGQKWMSCMSCLQKSTFVQDEQNDQMWFLYNLRYNFDYCIFGFPNATGVGTSPCTTSFACGPMQQALEFGNLSASSPEFGYCEDGSITGQYYQPCLQCVASGQQLFMANSLVGLEAGCLQQPPPGSFVGLNTTVFSELIIGIVSPATLIARPGTKRISNAAIAGMVVAGLVLTATVAACLFVQHRKKVNRRARASPAWGRAGFGIGRRPRSTMSFRCQNQGVGMAAVPRHMIAMKQGLDDASSDDSGVLAPDGPQRPRSVSPVSYSDERKRPADINTTTATATNTTTTGPSIMSTRMTPWRNQIALSSLVSLHDAEDLQEEAVTVRHATAVPLRTISTTKTRAAATVTTTSGFPPPPPPTHQSPSSATRGSPALSDHYFTNSTSATQLLPPNLISPYTPTEHFHQLPQGGGSSSGSSRGFSSPVSTTGGKVSSPLGSTAPQQQQQQRQQQQQQDGWPFTNSTWLPPPPPKSPRMVNTATAGAGMKFPPPLPR